MTKSKRNRCRRAKTPPPFDSMHADLTLQPVTQIYNKFMFAESLELLLPSQLGSGDELKESLAPAARVERIVSTESIASPTDNTLTQERRDPVRCIFVPLKNANII
jgi:hypothetical protein